MAMSHAMPPLSPSSYTLSFSLLSHPPLPSPQLIACLQCPPRHAPPRGQLCLHVTPPKRPSPPAPAPLALFPTTCASLAHLPPPTHPSPTRAPCCSRCSSLGPSLCSPSCRPPYASLLYLALLCRTMPCLAVPSRDASLSAFCSPCRPFVLPPLCYFISCCHRCAISYHAATVVLFHIMLPPLCYFISCCHRCAISYHAAAITPCSFLHLTMLLSPPHHFFLPLNYLHQAHHSTSSEATPHSAAAGTTLGYCPPSLPPRRTSYIHRPIPLLHIPQATFSFRFQPLDCLSSQLPSVPPSCPPPSILCLCPSPPCVCLPTSHHTRLSLSPIPNPPVRPLLCLPMRLSLRPPAAPRPSSHGCGSCCSASSTCTHSRRGGDYTSRCCCRCTTASPAGRSLPLSSTCVCALHSALLCICVCSAP
ncbi:unnamed protein product [Closterium sp. NIES-54]